MMRWPWKPTAGRMTCHQAARVIQSYLDGQSTEATARSVAAHLDTCRRCGMKAATFLAIKEALALREPSLDTAALERLAAFVEELAHAGPAAGSRG